MLPLVARVDDARRLGRAVIVVLGGGRGVGVLLKRLGGADGLAFAGRLGLGTSSRLAAEVGDGILILDGRVGRADGAATLDVGADLVSFHCWVQVSMAGSMTRLLRSLGLGAAGASFPSACLRLSMTEPGPAASGASWAPSA